MVESPDGIPNILYVSPSLPRTLPCIYTVCVQIPINQNVYETPYPTPRIPPPIEITPLPGRVMVYLLAISSLSTFGPNVRNLFFVEDPSRMKNEDHHQQSYSTSPMPTTKAPSPYPEEDYAPLASIASDSVNLRHMNAQKRMREEEEYGQRKRKRTSSQSGSVKPSKEEQLLVRLKEEKNLSWEDIAVRFQTNLGKTYQVSALQMQFKIWRERKRTWSETDVSFEISFVTPDHLYSDFEKGSSSRTSLRVLGGISI